MNKIREKKLNAIKSDILEVKDFVLSHSNNNINQLLNDDNTNDKADDTLTLTKIVDFDKNVSKLDISTKIQKDLHLLKSTLIEHEKILKKLLDKIK